MAYTPPPLLLKGVPKELGVVVLTPHPVPPEPVLQFELIKVVPACEPAILTEQPADVWSVISLVLARLTPSIISISPLLGQLGPKSQKAGQVLFPD